MANMDNKDENALCGERKFKAGTYNYRIAPSGGVGEVPEYTITVERGIPPSALDTCFTVKFEGDGVHALIHNGELVQRIRTIVEEWIRENPSWG
jgi:hypothetical protein